MARVGPQRHRGEKFLLRHDIVTTRPGLHEALLRH